MAEIFNQGFYNFQNDCTRITVIGQNKTTDKLDIYSAVVSAQDPVTGYPMDNLLGRLQDTTTIWDTKGRITNQTTQNDIENPSREGSINIFDDSVYETLKDNALNWRNALYDMILAEDFAISDGGELVKPLGIGGNVRLDSTGKLLKGKDWKWIFSTDAKLKISNTTLTQDNIYLNARNNRTLCVLLEMKQESNDGTAKVARYIICAGNISGSENEDKNTNEVPIYFESDFRFYDQFFIEGISSNFSNDVTSTSIDRLAVDYVKSGSAVSDPTDFGNSGDLIALIDTDDLSLDVKVSDGATAWTNITGTLNAGANIFSPKVTTTDLSASTDEYNYLFLSDGGVGSGTVIGSTVTNLLDYSLGTTGTYNLFEFNFITKTYTKVTNSTQI